MCATRQYSNPGDFLSLVGESGLLTLDIEPDPDEGCDDLVADDIYEYTVPELVVPPTFPAIRFEWAKSPADSTSLPTRLITPPRGFPKASSEFSLQPDSTLDAPAGVRAPAGVSAPARPVSRGAARALVMIGAGIVCGLSAYWLKLRSFEPLMDYGTLLLMPACALVPSLLAVRLFRRMKCPAFMAVPVAMAIAVAGYIFAALLISVLFAHGTPLSLDELSALGYLEIAKSMTQPISSLTTLPALRAWMWCAAQLALVIVFVSATTSRSCSLVTCRSR